MGRLFKTYLTKQTVLTGLLLALAAGISSWSILLSQPKKTHIKTSQTTRPSAFMEDVITTILNKQGTPSLKIETPKMVYYTENDKTDITKPFVTIFRHTPNPWHINAEYAQALDGTNQITFIEHVVIHHLGDIANPTTTLKTASLTVRPNKQLAETNDPVIITQPDTVVHATGMLANLDNGTVKLLSQAQGEYVPAS